MKTSAQVDPVQAALTYKNDADIARWSEDGRPRFVLVVEDDPLLLKRMVRDFRETGFHTLIADDAWSCLEIAAARPLDLIVLDTTLPSASGFAVCQLLRKKIATPIILLTTNPGEIDCTFGLELGASVCMAKPVSIEELLAHTKCLLNWDPLAAMKGPDEQINIGSITIYPARYEVAINHERKSMSKTPFRLLCFLALHAGQVVTRDKLLCFLSELQYSARPCALTELIRQIRQTIEVDGMCQGL